ncbi:MAG: RNA polymerase sigma factor [Gemmatimonadales bacterium]
MTHSLDQDGALLRRIRTGDRSAFGTLVTRYWPLLVEHAVRLGASADDADDAVQGVLIRIWAKRETWETAGSVRALLYRMTRDAILDQSKAALRRLRRHETQAAVGAPVPTPSEELDRSDLEAALAAAVADLSERRRAIYELTRIDGLTYREAAEVLGIAPQTAANHLTAALRQIHDSVRAHLDPPRASHPTDRRRSRG